RGCLARRIPGGDGRGALRAHSVLQARRATSAQLEKILPRFNISGLAENVLHNLNLAWHRLDAWPDVPGGLARLKRRLCIAPCSNGNISLMVGIARRNNLPWDRSEERRVGKEGEA